jgi:rhodanese-related sulfurtransferase
MNYNIKKNLNLAITLIITILILGTVGNAFENQKHIYDTNKETLSSDIEKGFSNLTVEETWNLLNDTSNGIQIPIDVRTDPEWIYEHIDTPRPEHPRHHCKCEWSSETILNEFMTLYEGETIILYCLGGYRSVEAANILIDNGYNGEIYNMLGGITAWKESGYPTIENQPPNPPEIQGPSKGKPGEKQQYTISTIDPEDNKIFYYINWSDGTNTTYTGPHISGEEININHTWSDRGNYIINVTSWDYYQAKSDFTTYEVKISKTKNRITIWTLRDILINIYEFLNNITERILLYNI